MTDHKPCLALMEGSSLNNRLLQFALALQQFDVQIIHRPRQSHSNADGMSRQAWPDDDEAAQCLSDSPPGRILAGGVVGGGMRSETEKMTNKRKTETEKMTDKRKKEKEMKTERR